MFWSGVRRTFEISVQDVIKILQKNIFLKARSSGLDCLSVLKLLKIK